MQPATDGMFRRIQVFIAVYAALLVATAAGLHHKTAAIPVAATRAAETDDGVPEPVDSAPEVGCDESERLAVGSMAAADENLVEAFEISKSPHEFLGVAVAIEGQNWWFAVDSGASQTVVDIRIALHLDMVSLRPTGPESGGRRVHLTAARIGKSRIPFGGEVHYTDLSDFRNAGSPLLYGILGMDFLKSHVISIDLNAGKLSFLRSVPDSSGHELRLSRDRFGRPSLRIDLAENRRSWFILDTGCLGPGAGTIEARTFTNLAGEADLTVTREGAWCLGINGWERCREALLKRLHVGSFEHFDVPFFENKGANLLGLGYLSRYVATIDFPRDRLYLRKASGFEDAPAQWFGTPGFEIPRQPLERPFGETGQWLTTKAGVFR